MRQKYSFYKRNKGYIFSFCPSTSDFSGFPKKGLSLSTQKIIIMKKLFVTLVLVASLFKAKADEGMWLPMLLGQQVYAAVVIAKLALGEFQCGLAIQRADCSQLDVERNT